MGYKIIPTTTYPDRTQETRLDGKAFRFRFRWIERAGAWVMDMRTAAGDPIVLCRRLSLSSRPLLGVLHPERPPGELWVVDRTDSGAEATADDFGTRVQLIYVEAGTV